jgi:hypothetical protein
MIIQKAFIFNRPLYDGMKASTINGLRANLVEVYSSVHANDAQLENVFMPTHWEQLHSYDLVIWGEEEISQVDQLAGSPRTGQILLMIDGGDITKIRYNLKIKPHLLFKRELFKKIHQKIKGSIYPFSFAVEDMYWQDLIPHHARQYDYSCMLRLASNPFRTKLKEALERVELKMNLGLSHFVGETGEISYGGDKAFRRPTPKYFEVLNQSRVSINCYGAGQDCYRFWEILGSGAMLLSQRLEIEMAQPFQDGVHALFFDNLKEFEEKFKFSMHNPDQVQEIAFNGYAHAKEFHSVYERGRYLLEKIQENVPAIENSTQLKQQYIHWQAIRKSNNLIYYQRKHLLRLKNFFIK